MNLVLKLIHSIVMLYFWDKLKIKKQMKMKYLLSFVIATTFLYSCSKVEGKGGSATVKGVVMEQLYNSIGNPISGGKYEAADQDVYLIYGQDDTFYDDDIKTSYDGSFVFNYLQKGKYTLYVYEDCSSCASGKKEILVPFEITERNQVIDLDTIVIKKQL